MTLASSPRGRHGLGDRLRLLAGIGINVTGATVLLVEALWHSGLSV
jgi:hypothetical protein